MTALWKKHRLFYADLRKQGDRAGESEEIEVRADRDYITSYDYKDAKMLYF